MKKIIHSIISAILFIGLPSAHAQMSPILPYGEHSLSEMKTFALGDSKKSVDFRKEMLSIINKGLRKAGKSLVVTQNHITTIFEKHITIEEVQLKKGTFSNSGWNSKTNSTVFYVSKVDYEGFAGIFTYDGVSIVLFKSNCLNLLIVEVEMPQEGIPEPLPKTKPKDPDPIVPPKKDTVWMIQEKIVDREVEAPKQQCCEERQVEYYPQQAPRYPQQRPVYMNSGPRVSLNVGVRYTSNRQQVVYQPRMGYQGPQRGYDPRTMPRGIPSYPRTMPRGIPSNPPNRVVMPGRPVSPGVPSQGRFMPGGMR